MKSDKSRHYKGMVSCDKGETRNTSSIDNKGPSGNTDQGKISWFHVIKLEMWGKAQIIQLITLCEVKSRKCGSEVTWPDRGQRPTSSLVTQSHKSMVLISCYLPRNDTGLLENSEILNLTSFLIGRGLNPWSLIIKQSKIWMSVLICTCFTKLNVSAVLCVCVCAFLYVLAFNELR